jgi:hypothetical protein
MTDTPLATPDVTPVQKLVGAFTLVLATGLAAATSFGVNLSVDQDTKILALWGALGGFIVIADSIIRHGRAQAAAAKQIATATIAAAKTPPARKPAAAKAKP